MIKEIAGEERVYVPDSRKPLIRLGDDVRCVHPSLPAYFVRMDHTNTLCGACNRVWRVGDEHPEWL